MLTKPFCCGSYRERKLVEIGSEMATRRGGVIVLDNVLWRGDVADEKINDEGAQLMRTLNLKIRDDQRVSAVMLTLGDGLTVVRKL
jgi:caffeoyl-CoA O-methyltransferase